MAPKIKKLLEDCRDYPNENKELDLVDRGIGNLTEYSMLFELKRLVRLSLAHNSLSTLPADIGELTNLEHLNVAGNSIKELPDNVCSLARLKSINLSYNKMNSLPVRMGQMPSLEYIDANYNNLSERNMPSSFWLCENLRVLFLADNDFEFMPPAIGGMKTLQILCLRDNDLICLPREIGQLSRLRELDIRGNRLTVVPPELADVDFSGSRQLVELAKNPWVASLKNQLNLGNSHFLEYLRTQDYRAMYERHISSNPAPPAKVNDKSKKESRK